MEEMLVVFGACCHLPIVCLVASSMTSSDNMNVKNQRLAKATLINASFRNGIHSSERESLTG